MTMRLRFLLALAAALAAGFAAADPGAAQSPDGRVRLVRAETEPATVGFGEAATVRVELRAGPGIALFLPDTLLAGTDMAGLGPGRWAVGPGAADSVTISATYPIVGYRPGIRELPKLEVAVAERAGGGEAVVLPIREAVAAGGALRTVEVPLGSTTVADYAPVEEAAEGEALSPRPPADVLGGRWSRWLVLVVGLATLAGAGGVGTLLPRWWGERGARLLARLRGRTAKQETLRELDRVRSLGWHLDGRVDDFYASSSDALRAFASRLDPQWTGALTTAELLERIEARLGAARAEKLAAALTNAERAKFGTERPDSASAERDWAAIRDWVREAPEP